MESADHASEAARAGDACVHSSINPTSVDAGRQASEKPADAADPTDKSVPDKTIEPARDKRCRSAQGDNGVLVKFVDPHLVFEKTKDRRLRVLERISLAGAAIDQNSEADPAGHESEGDEQHWLDKEAEVERDRFA